MPTASKVPILTAVLSARADVPCKPLDAMDAPTCARILQVHFAGLLMQAGLQAVPARSR